MGRTVDRILDVNLNRAREALRVIEEYARFLLPPSFASRKLFLRIKSFRHCIAELDRRRGRGWFRARNVEEDPGRRADERGKSRRRISDILRANIKRLQEALRAIEEYAKVGDPSMSNAAGRMRFDAYRLEQDLDALDIRRRLADARLYVLLSSDIVRGDLFRAAAEAVRGGADIVQLREKGIADRRFVAMAGRVGAICRERGVLFIVNDRVDIALAAGADGVHLGEEDLAIAQARKILGDHAIIGATSHDFPEARRAVRAGADYLSVGPMFPSSTKPSLAADGFSYVRRMARSIDLPFFCIGGIDDGNVRRVVSAGGVRVAVCSSVVAARNIASATRRLKRILCAHRS